jgi:hypothetical protein
MPRQGPPGRDRGHSPDPASRSTSPYRVRAMLTRISSTAGTSWIFREKTRRHEGATQKKGGLEPVPDRDREGMRKTPPRRLCHQLARSRPGGNCSGRDYGLGQTRLPQPARLSVVVSSGGRVTVPTIAGPLHNPCEALADKAPPVQGRGWGGECGGECSLTPVRRADNPHPNPSPEGEGLAPSDLCKGPTTAAIAGLAAGRLRRRTDARRPAYCGLSPIRRKVAPPRRIGRAE